MKKELEIELQKLKNDFKNVIFDKESVKGDVMEKYEDMKAKTDNLLTGLKDKADSYYDHSTELMLKSINDFRKKYLNK